MIFDGNYHFSHSVDVATGELSPMSKLLFIEQTLALNFPVTLLTLSGIMATHLVVICEERGTSPVEPAPLRAVLQVHVLEYSMALPLLFI